MGHTVLDVYCVPYGMAPVFRGEVRPREHSSYHIGKRAVGTFHYFVLEEGNGDSVL